MAALVPDTVHLRLDTIEAALNESGIIDRAGGWDAFPDVGYRTAWAMTRDLLASGRSVVADSVNPISITRAGWESCDRDTGSPVLNVEVVCSDTNSHRQRVEQRTSDLAGLTVPTWTQVEQRLYEPWDEEVVRVDTALGVDGPAEEISKRIEHLKR